MPKALGSELTDFYENGFPEGYFHEDYDESIDPDNFVPTQKYELNDLGWIIKDDGTEEVSFASAFRKWKKQQTTTVILVEVPKEDELTAKVKIKQLGYKVRWSQSQYRNYLGQLRRLKGANFVNGVLTLLAKHTSGFPGTVTIIQKAGIL